MSPRVLKHLNSKKSQISRLHFSGFSPKFRLIQCHITKTNTVFLVFLYFFFQIPLTSVENFPTEPQVSDSEQILFITAKKGETSGRLDFYQFNEGEWIIILENIPVQLGRNGISLPENKREGDGYTPAGFFPIKRIAGKQKREIRNLEYTEVSKAHFWSNNPKSKNYNQLIDHYEKGSIPLGDSYIYDLFIVIEHNTKPALPGFGSMIFLHVWKDDKPTSGCVGLDASKMEIIVNQMDGNKKPFIVIADQ